MSFESRCGTCDRASWRLSTTRVSAFSAASSAAPAGIALSGDHAAERTARLNPDDLEAQDAAARA